VWAGLASGLLLLIVVGAWTLKVGGASIDLSTCCQAIAIAGTSSHVLGLAGLLLALVAGGWALKRFLVYRRVGRAKAGLNQLAVDTLDKIWLLSNNFAHPLREGAWMATYRRENKADDLEDLKQRLAQLCAAARADAETQTINSLRNALNYALGITHKMREWTVQGHSHPQAVQLLYGHRQALTQLVEALKGNAQGMQQLAHVELGTRLESQTLRRGPEVYGDASVHICCCFKPWHDPALDIPHLVVVHVETPFAPHPESIVMLHKDYKWRDQLELQQLISSKAYAVSGSLGFAELGVA
jgi:hypothetical protein